MIVTSEEFSPTHDFFDYTTGRRQHPRRSWMEAGNRQPQRGRSSNKFTR